VQIRAAVLEEFAKPLVVQDVELDGPRSGEVLVRLKACGVCHTDLYTASGADPSGYAPTVLGHEGARVSRRSERESRASRPATTWSRSSPPSAGVRPLREDKTNICLAIRDEQNQGHLPDGTTRLHRGDERVRHFMGTSTGIGAALYIAKVEPGSTCVVFGAGLVGLGAVAGCRLAGADRIVAVDPSEERLEHATAQGATDTLVGGPDTVEKILELTGGFGADYTFEATGLVGVMRQAVESARMGWGLCTIAGVAGKGEVLEVVPRFLITGRRIAGASFGCAKGPDRVPELVDLYTAGDLDLESLVTRRVQLDEVNHAFEAMERQDGIRTVITY
jgi:S-(hydroxymethyl)glutathione dehydrogenase / alcohol dehydrogenase